MYCEVKYSRVLSRRGGGGFLVINGEVSKLRCGHARYADARAPH